MIIKEWNWNFTFHIPGNYTISLRVFDNEGFQDEDSIWIRVLDTKKPTAHAGEDILIEPGGIMRLGDNGSRDNVGIVNYTWTFEYIGSQMILHGKYVNFEVLRPAKFVVKLTVYDIDGNYGEDWLIVTVRKDDEKGKDDPAVPDKGSGSSIGIWITSIALILIAAGTVLFFMIRNRRYGEEEPPPKEGVVDSDSGEHGTSPRNEGEDS